MKTEVTDKHGNQIDVTKATTGKLKATLQFYEGVVYRNNKSLDRMNLMVLLPNDYAIICDELENRGATMHKSFNWVKPTKDF